MNIVGFGLQRLGRGFLTSGVPVLRGNIDPSGVSHQHGAHQQNQKNPHQPESFHRQLH